MPSLRQPLMIEAAGQQLSALLDRPPQTDACLVLAHSAGAGMHHPLLEHLAAGLSERGIATLRYQFPYMERGSKRPDPPRVAHAAVRAAVAEAKRQFPETPLFAGGRSFGGRMTSQAQAISPLPDVRGLAFIGFPLHPADKPSEQRGKHLFEIGIPMLFLQGTRDALARLDLLTALVSRLGNGASLKVFEEADHSFHVPARYGKDQDIRAAVVDNLAEWIADRARPEMDHQFNQSRSDS